MTSAVPAVSATSPRRRLLLVAGLATLGCARLSAADAPPAPGDDRALLQQRLDALEARLRTLEAAKPETGAAGGAGSALSFGAYGEIKYGALQNPDADGAWQNGFDGGRLTLMPSYAVTDRILFKAEVEFEHGGIALDDDDKLGGAVEVEQAYFDIAIDEHFHWRPPGIDLVPFGRTNLAHEPTLFYSVDRPELANGLIPTTWFAGSTSIHGILAGPVSYEFQVSTSLVDDGGNVHDVTSAKTPPDPSGYPAGIDGHDGLGLARPTVGDFAQESNALGYALRIAYSIPALRGLDGSTSVYWTPNVVPRGAYASDASGVKTRSLGHCSLTMADTELRWRQPGDQGFELRAEAVLAHFSNPGNLRANNDGDAGDNVGKTMWGASGEIAYHWRAPRVDWDVVPFYRYTREMLQNEGFAGQDDDAPTGSGRISFHTVGVAIFPVPDLVIKFDYQAVRDGTTEGARSDHVLGGVGFFF
jgi:hypothetical protein